MIYFELFWSFFQIGLFSIGGGYASISLIQQQVIDVHSWLTASQFADITAIAEMTPGPIAINSATFVGIRIAGLPGAICATAGCVLPSFIIVLFLAHIYYRYRSLHIMQGILEALHPAVIAMIASAVVSLVILSVYGERYLPADLSGTDIRAAGLFMATLFVLLKWKKDPLLVMLTSGLAGLVLYAVF